MGMYKFMMSCGHQAKREVADPAKYYNIDREYYRKQGLCDKCWDRLRADKEKLNEKITNDIEKAIKQLKSDWIPVNERLPEKSDNQI